MSAQLSKASTYTINITSDIVCPWCYIGHTRLTKAINNHKKQHPQDQFNLTYRPFYLNPPPQALHAATGKTAPPAFPTDSQPRRQYYAAKFGAQRAELIFQRLGQAAREEGLNFQFGGKTGSSRNGHRLVHFAQQQGRDTQDGGNDNNNNDNDNTTTTTATDGSPSRLGQEAQDRVMQGLWRRYFEEEIDITDLEVLVEVGVEANLGSTADEIREYLVSGADGEIVDELAENARAADGISGVPFYIVQDRWIVEGAEEPATFEDLFKKWKTVEESEG